MQLKISWDSLLGTVYLDCPEGYRPQHKVKGRTLTSREMAESRSTSLCLTSSALASVPFHTTWGDFIEGLPAAPSGFNSMATVTDKFSKARCLVAGKKSDGMAFAQRFATTVHTVWRVPELMISDQDCCFVSARPSALIALYRPFASCLPPPIAGLPFYPMPSSPTPRYTTLSSTTGFSPNSILYAHSPRLFGDRAFGEISADAEYSWAQASQKR